MNEYPDEWKRGIIQSRIRELADHRCEQCGMEFHPGTNLAISARNRRGRPIVGTVHHINEDKSDCSPENLVFLCQCCHWTLHLYQWQPGKPLLLRWNGEPPRWFAPRGIQWQPHPQMRLFKIGVRMSYKEEQEMERRNKVWRKEKVLGSNFWVCHAGGHSIRVKVAGQLPPDECPECAKRIQSGKAKFRQQGLGF